MNKSSLGWLIVLLFCVALRADAQSNEPYSAIQIIRSGAGLSFRNAINARPSGSAVSAAALHKLRALVAASPTKNGQNYAATIASGRSLYNGGTGALAIATGQEVRIGRLHQRPRCNKIAVQRQG